MKAVSLLLLAALAFGQTTVADLLEQKTLQEIRAYDDALDGVLGVAAVDLTTGRTLSHNGNVIFPQASSIKIPIMIQMFRAARAGELSFANVLTLTEKDAAGGSGRLQQDLKKGPVTLTIGDLVKAMIEHSDNTATNRCIRLVGMEAVNRALQELGFQATRLRRMMMDTAAAQRDDENVSTPLEMVRLVELIYRGQVVDEAASQEMLKIMKLVKAGMRKAIPEAVELASKPGGVGGVKCETGIVFLPNRPFALSVMSTYLPDVKDAKDDPVVDVAGIVFAYFDKLAHSNRYGHRVR